MTSQKVHNTKRRTGQNEATRPISTPTSFFYAIFHIFAKVDLFEKPSKNNKFSKLQSNTSFLTTCPCLHTPGKFLKPSLYRYMVYRVTKVAGDLGETPPGVLAF